MVADEPTFARLMAAAQDGDKAATNVLLSEAGLWLERYFRKRIPPHSIDDLVQDVLIAFYTKRATWDPSRPFLPWLDAIARYRWVDHLRKVYKHESQELMDDGNKFTPNMMEIGCIGKFQTKCMPSCANMCTKCGIVWCKNECAHSK